MIHKNILDKNEICYSLLSSYNEPNVLIPVKGVIADIKYDYGEPNYLINLKKFYDSMTFLKSHVFNMFFYTAFNQTHKSRLNFSDIKNNDDLKTYLQINKINVVSHSLMTFKSKAEMSKIFNKLNEYFIYINFLSLKENLTRTLYKGDLKLRYKSDFFRRLKRFIGDRFPNNKGVTFENIVRDINLTKPINKLKYEKIKRTSYLKKGI